MRVLPPALLLLCLLVAGCGRSRPGAGATVPAGSPESVPPPELLFLPSGELEEGTGISDEPAGESVDETPERPRSQGEEPAAPRDVARPSRPDDPDEVIRRWMIGDAASGLPKQFGETAPAKRGATPDGWLAYLAIQPNLEVSQREAALKRLLDGPISDPLRQLILLDITSDLSFKSRQAAFVRRYGFYANWFNRFTYAASRAVQGNLQATGQVMVDAVFDRIGASEVTPAERRIYKLLRDLEQEGRSSRKDQKRIVKLGRSIDEAVAESDMERAEFALRQNDPDLAKFYARGAQVRLPASGRAKRLENQAEAEMAARRRRFVASNQVGYPDRKPPFRADEPELLRAALSRRHSDLVAQLERHDVALKARASRGKDGAAPEDARPLDPGQEFLARLLASLPDQNTAATLAMRQWAGTLREAGYAPRDETLWIKNMLQDPQFNPDLRLARAQSSRRGHLASFIFLGPESSRERAYNFASRMTSAFDALAGIGVFYIFETFYRAGIVAFSPPPPREEMLDAAAAFIRASPADRTSRREAAWLIEQYLDAGRFDRARDVLERYGELDRAKSEELLAMEARRTYQTAAAAPTGSPEQRYLLKRTMEIAPGSAPAKQAEKKLARAEKERGEPWEVEATWGAVAKWFPEPLPGPFPGKPQWFDGEAANGEVVGDRVRFEGEGLHPESVMITYSVREAGRSDYVQEWLLLASSPPSVEAWIRYQLAEQKRVEEESARLGRPRIPYSFIGGVGLSGVDFYPTLRPIETQPGELDLYRPGP